MSLSKSKITKLVTGFAGFAVALGFAVAPAIASADTAASIQAQINSLMSTIQSLQSQLSATTGGSTTVSGYMFNTNLTLGSKGPDVMALQKFLNSNAATHVSVSGAGSPGMETSFFGPATKAAVAMFQVANGISPTAGYFGALTRAKVNAMESTVTTGGTGTVGTTTYPAGCTSFNGYSVTTGQLCTSGTGTTPVVGGSLVFNASTQPANSLAPGNAARVPFTTFTLTNTGTNVVTVNGVTVQRTGLANDSVFTGVVLVDSNNVQLGTSKTFNSNHQAVVGDTFTVNPGETKVLTVAGNMQTPLTLQTYAGQVASIAVVGVNSTATVSGSFPVTGASQTINSSLIIGTVSTSTSSFDPGSAQSKSIGQTGVRFTGVRFTANSSEDLKLYSLRWRQTGSVSSADVSNMVTVVNGTSYPTTLSADGKYYTTVFTGGLLIPKGNSIDVYIQGDLTGSNSATRTVKLDIDKTTDVYFVGQLYGYGVAPTSLDNHLAYGYITTIQGGSATTIQNNTAVASANVPVNVQNTVLGGFQTNFLGEPVSVSGMKFTVATSSVTDTSNGYLTSVSIVDQNGSVVAGPVDATLISGGTSGEQLVFTDTVTFPVGLESYTLKGKVPSGWVNGSSFYLTTTPSTWTNPTGQSSGNNVTLGIGLTTLNTMTVKGATLTVTASQNPVAQTIVSGNSVVLASFNLDASQSGEDIRMNSLPVYNNLGTTAGLNTCQLWNGTTALNTGTNVKTSISTGSNVFNFDNSLVISKGTVVTLTLACNITSGTSGNYQFGVNSSYTPSVTGVQSGNTLSSPGLAVVTTNSGVQTISGTGGTFALTIDPSSPSRTLVAGGTTGVTVGVMKLRASNENVNLTKIGLTLAGGTYGTKSTASGGDANSGVNDIVQAYIYNGSTLVGTAQFTPGSSVATSSLISPLLLTNNVDTQLTIKADLSDINASAAGGIGNLVTISPLNAQGTGASSGKTIDVAGSGTVSGVQLFNTYPTVAFVANSATNPQGINQVLKKFTITANSAGPVSIGTTTISIATSSAAVTNIKLYAYSDAGYSQGVSSQNSGGQIGNTQCSLGCAGTTASTVVFASAQNANAALQIPADTTIYFAVLGTVTPVSSPTQWSVNTTLLGDTAPNTAHWTSGYNMATSTNAQVFDTSADSNFIWSDNASTTAASTDVDWTNGYYVPGLPSSGL